MHMISASIMRKSWLVYSLLLLSMCTQTNKSTTEKVSKPNIIYILADQFRAQATGYNGDPNANTPNLDRLAASAVNFKTAVSVSPVCTPYRSALMTGRYPLSTGMFMNDLYYRVKNFVWLKFLRMQDMKPDI